MSRRSRSRHVGEWTPKSHWERVYANKLPTQLNWYQPHALRSLDLIRRVSPPPDGAIVDVGGGASTLISDLLDAGYHDLTVLAEPAPLP